MATETPNEKTPFWEKNKRKNDGFLCMNFQKGKKRKNICLEKCKKVLREKHLFRAAGQSILTVPRRFIQFVGQTAPVRRVYVISLNYRDARPIYEQVKDGLRRLVVTGAIAPGDKLPSVRALASSLAINPNTIQRAYEALEGEGYLYTVAGKGSFAAEQKNVDEGRRSELLSRFDAAAAELLFLGMTVRELTDRLCFLTKEVQL